VDLNTLFDKELISRYDKSGPRYTSYPTAVQFHQAFAESQYRAIAQKITSDELNRTKKSPVSLYFHLPFCNTVCFYCGCNKVVTKNRSKAAPYLARLHREIAMQAALFDHHRMVDQLHWGGGTPTFISHDEMRELMAVTRQHFQLRDDDSGEYSIEIDPREVTDETISLLRELGFNRLSMGVQDFDPVVQKSVNRIQPEAQTLAAIAAARANDFKSISVDLIYGLPHQTTESFRATVNKIIEVSPDRVSAFNYAHLPEMFKPQRRINEADLPKPVEKLEILRNTIEQLIQAGYVYIGMDHFAKPTDELAIAQQSGSLYRNFQGYSTHADCDLVAMGITSIGQVGNTYSQNVKTLDAYYELIDSGHIPVYRGVELSADDILRREVISQLICHYRLDVTSIEKKYNIQFSEYFTEEINELVSMESDGLLTITSHEIEVMSAGWLLIRNVCMVFDRYLRHDTGQRFSKVI